MQWSASASGFGRGVLYGFGCGFLVCMVGTARRHNHAHKMTTLRSETRTFRISRNIYAEQYIAKSRNNLIKSSAFSNKREGSILRVRRWIRMLERDMHKKEKAAGQGSGCMTAS
jgi:hypothetical protein